MNKFIGIVLTDPSNRVTINKLFDSVTTAKAAKEQTEAELKLHRAVILIDDEEI